MKNSSWFVVGIFFTGIAVFQGILLIHTHEFDAVFGFLFTLVSSSCLIAFNYKDFKKMQELATKC